MKLAQQLLDDLQNTKRYSCLSEYNGWVTDVVEFLEHAARIQRSIPEDPTIRNQLDLPFEAPPKPGEIRY